MGDVDWWRRGKENYFPFLTICSRCLLICCVVFLDSLLIKYSFVHWSNILSVWMSCWKVTMSFCIMNLDKNIFIKKLRLVPIFRPYLVLLTWYWQVFWYWVVRCLPWWNVNDKLFAIQCIAFLETISSQNVWFLCVFEIYLFLYFFAIFLRFFLLAERLCFWRCCRVCLTDILGIWLISSLLQK